MVLIINVENIFMLDIFAGIMITFSYFFFKKLKNTAYIFNLKNVTL